MMGEGEVMQLGVGMRVLEVAVDQHLVGVLELIGELDLATPLSHQQRLQMLEMLCRRRK